MGGPVFKDIKLWALSENQVMADHPYA